MTREEIYQQCVEKIAKTNCLLLESATGTGKTAISLKLCNYLLNHKIGKIGDINVLILVAKRVHKQTWKEEIEKWGGIKHPLVHAEAGDGKVNIRMECYESMHKCDGKYDILLCDEVHHIGSEIRLELLKSIRYDYLIGLSATIPKKLKQYFKYRYHSEVVTCDIVEAINDDILPEPQILLFPLILDNRANTERIELHSRASGPIVYAEYKDIRKYKFKSNIHAIISCTQKQKLITLDDDIAYYKKRYMETRNPGMERSWLYLAGKRLEYLANCKNQIVSDILKKLDKSRTITFCKTVEQADILGKWNIHSKNQNSDWVYEQFNKKRIHHITTVNILNENANLVDCKYAIFVNLSSSEVIQVQRTGRALRHKSPVIIIPYYKDTREEEIVTKQLEGFNKKSIKVIHSIQEI